MQPTYTPTVYTYPHPRDCDAIQGRLEACMTRCDKCAADAPHYEPEDEDYELDMGLAGSLE